MIFGTATNGAGLPPPASPSRSTAAATTEDDDHSHVEQMARAATNQPRTPVRTVRVEDPHDQSRRNPRRG
jgi:hypothetical protein